MIRPRTWLSRPRTWPLRPRPRKLSLRTTQGQGLTSLRWLYGNYLWVYHNVVLGNECVERLSESVEKSWSEQKLIKVLTEMKCNAVHNQQFHLHTALQRQHTVRCILTLWKVWWNNNISPINCTPKTQQASNDARLKQLNAAVWVSEWVNQANVNHRVVTEQVQSASTDCWMLAEKQVKSASDGN